MRVSGATPFHPRTRRRSASLGHEADTLFTLPVHWPDVTAAAGHVNASSAALTSAGRQYELSTPVQYFRRQKPQPAICPGS